jgi:transposase-like protein
LAVQRVKDREAILVVVKELGMGDQTLRNWVKAQAEGKLRGADNKVVTLEAMELSRLRAENARLKRENEIIKSSGVLCQGYSVKYAWIDVKRKTNALTEMCAVLDIGLCVYRAWKRGGAPARKRLMDTQMLAIICVIHAELKGAYGSPRMVRELRRRGFTAGKGRRRRLMREYGLRARHKRRYKNEGGQFRIHLSLF